MILPHASRWRLLCLRFDRIRDHRVFLQSMTVLGHPISPQNLEVLEIVKTGDYIELSAPSFWPDDKLIFKNGATSKLTWLRVRAFRDGLFPFSFHTITFLQIDKADFMTLKEFECVAQLPALVSLSLSDAEIDAFETPSRPVIAPKLRYFRYQSNCIMFCLWRLLKAPCLELLIFKDVVIEDGNREYSFDPVDRQECDHFPSLKTIGFINCDVFSLEDSNDKFLLHLAQATPDVTRLMILYTEEDHIILPRILEHGDVTYWPNLTTVFYSDKMLSQEDINIIRTRIAEMLKHQATTKPQKHCTYQICNSHLNVLNAEEGDSRDRWKSLQTGEFYDIICSGNVQEVPEWCSWPSELSTEFYYSSEEDFDPDFSTT
ncbi:hypothetical protein HYPSUDRAFT_756991 [Hypholoma sublateritium FD-334 SS-4]|uniref:F-box domain-containing protein n=1 Tax=Hypholoma sublateritium (strain FD-334 SS-4) TaxID=945553 RepID=A0A0D2PMC8_HYPSF|nr:hypothetical protein HYPSUDRAFT_756991 [Hypholoma sublateritium FD-334 SS-4]